MNRRAWSHRWVVTLCAGLTAGCGGDADLGSDAHGPRPNLVLVVLDTTRPDWLSAYGHPQPTTPYLDRFARTGTRFDRAYSSSSWTLPAHSTMFTGLPPGMHGATQSRARVHEQIPLLAETLSEAGYDTAGFSANPWVGEKSGLDRGFHTFQKLRPRKRAWLAGRTEAEQAGASEATERITAWMTRKRPADPTSGQKPFFLFVNLMRAHHPYIPSPHAARSLLAQDRKTLRDTLAEFYPELPRNPPSSLMNRHYERERPLSEAEWTRLIGLYRASVLSGDEELRDVMQAVDSLSDPENTLVLIVSDHGESFGEHGHFGHILNLYETSIRVVFLARGPGFAAGQSRDQLAHLADVYATFLSAARLPVPPNCSGIDLARSPSSQRVLSAVLDLPRIHFKAFREDVLSSGVLDVYERSVWAAVSERFKLIARSDGTEELYDLLEDPGEERPIDASTWAPDSKNGRMLAALRASVNESRAMAKLTAEEELDIDEETLESLRALGYLK